MQCMMKIYFFYFFYICSTKLVSFFCFKVMKNINEYKIYMYTCVVAHLFWVAGCCLADWVDFHFETHLHFGLVYSLDEVPHSLLFPPAVSLDHPHPHFHWLWAAP